MYYLRLEPPQNFVKREVTVQFIKSAVHNLNKVLWHSARRGDK